ncbi:uncharacterized protein LOC107883830 isoform X2 [Acyrthosiphon pisum]|uniref:DUF4806 domain-containing protein n=1 Tax=Acyrthosiphon pisum TaxID=7029 RepID=A0A8R2D3T6_ACYPI|nr:uncharacterized protein LOC107883830 isoform X2 [Acyrthosiphon pisum]|eukprot:XP_016660141.1 PREDICTED: uncharacterized protein LOC107883830 isoform X2 [Acyrthosiphon pisum]
MADNKRKVSPRWVIVLFPEYNKEYSVVPINWLTQTNPQFCYWPPGIVDSDVLQMAEDPQYTWTKYQVNVHGGNKTYDNFRKAWYQQVEIEKSTTETEIEEHEVLRHKRTKKMPSLKNKSVFDVSDESDNSRNSDSCFDVMASSSNQHLTVTVPAAPIGILASTSSFSPTVGVESAYSLDYTELMPKISKQTIQTAHLCSASDISPKQSNSIDTLSEMVLQQNNDQTVKMMLNRILIKIANIENILSKNNEDNSALLDESFISKFPITNAEGFLLVETCILNEHSFVSKLKFFIRSIGGRDGKEHIIRSLSKLLTNEYAGKCTMTGRGKNIITKLGDTELIKILTKVIKENSKNNITNSDIEVEIAEWLRRANTRVHREKQN